MSSDEKVGIIPEVLEMVEWSGCVFPTESNPAIISIQPAPQSDPRTPEM